MEGRIKKNRVLRRIVALQQVMSNSNPVIRPSRRHKDPDVLNATLGRSQRETWQEILDRDTEFLNAALQRRAESQKKEKPAPRKVYIAGPGQPNSERLHPIDGPIGPMFFDRYYTRR